MQSGFKGWMMGLDNGYGPTICINESRVGNISCLPPGHYTHTFDSSNPYQGGNIVNYQGVLMHLIGCWKWDGSGIVESIYINGEYVQPTNSYSGNPSMSANTTSMLIGGRGNPSTGDGTCYGMKIYSARVWHKELDQSTVDLLYAAGKYTSALSVPGAGGDAAGVVLPVQNGLTAHHSWFSFQDNNTWEDLTGNGHHATRQGSGTVSLVSAANANTTGFGGLGPWPYINGDENSRWDIFGGQTLNSDYTIVYIMRYDVDANYRGRIIDMKGRNYLLGAYSNSIGRSYQSGWLTYSPSMQKTEWVLGIEMPNRQVRRGTVTTQWADNTGGGSSHTNLVATINNAGEKSDYNIAEMIYYNRKFTDSEIDDMKDWLDDYAAGLVHDNYTSSAGAAPAATIYWWGGNTPHLSLFWNSSQRNYYNGGVWNSFDYFQNVLPSHHQTSTTGTLDIGDQNVGDQNIHIEFAAGTVSNIRIRGQTSSTAYAFWTGSQWEGQTMANGHDSTGRHNMNHNEHLVWTNNDGTYAELNIVPPSNATQLGLLNGDGRKYILVEIS
jgi:hypothetical protein